MSVKVGEVKAYSARAVLTEATAVRARAAQSFMVKSVRWSEMGPLDSSYVLLYTFQIPFRREGSHTGYVSWLTGPAYLVWQYQVW